MKTPLPDWDAIGFQFTRTDVIYHTTGDLDRDPVWNEGRFLPFGDIPYSPAAAVLSYGIGIFEGLKARRSPDGRLLLFRPDANARRFQRSAETLMMAPFPPERFEDAAVELVRRNERFVPPAGKGSFYLRPTEHAVQPRLGMGPCRRFAVTMYGSPVGPYFPNGEPSGVRLKVLRQGRVAPGGTGHAKTLGNYAGPIPILDRAHREGYDDVLYLDACHRSFLTETSGSNTFVVLGSGVVATPPLDDQILPGITRDSVIRLAREKLGLSVEERPVPIDEILEDAVELFAVGTAWTVQPVREIVLDGRPHAFRKNEVGLAIYNALSAIQNGTVPDPYGWVREL